MGGYRQKFSDQPYCHVFFRIDSLFFGKKHIDTGENQKSAKDHQRPFKLSYQRGPGADHYPAHDQRTQNSPEQDPVMIG